MRVILAMLTYRRPGGLRRALDGLAAARADAAARSGVHGVHPLELEILVVDNDPQASARSAVEADGRAVYRHEPRPGIAAARNNALDGAAHGDLLVFIDDDEMPQNGWLVALLRTWNQTRADGVQGRVVQDFETAPEPWISSGGWFEKRTLPTGTAIGTAETNNLLLDLRTVRRIGLRFDESLGHAGGEDTEFTRALVAAGGRLVWCDDAVVAEVIPDERQTRRFVLLRSLAHGCTDVAADLNLANGRPRRLVVRGSAIGSGAARIVVGMSRLVVGVATQDVTHRARGARTTMRGIGMLTRAGGLIVEEYAEGGARLRRVGRH